MKLVKGSELTEATKREVLNAFGYRWTVENLDRAKAWIKRPERFPTIAPITDAKWLEETAFYVNKDGSLSASRNYCEPAYLAD